MARVDKLVGCSVKPFFASLLHLNALAQSTDPLNQSVNKALSNSLLKEQNDSVKDRTDLGRYGSAFDYRSDGVNVYRLAAEDCESMFLLHTITTSNGSIYFRKFNENVTKDPQAILETGSFRCMVRVTVSEGKSMELIVEDLPEFPCDTARMSVSIREPQSNFSGLSDLHPPNVDFEKELYECFNGRNSQVYTESNVVDIFVSPVEQRFSGLHWLIVHFRATQVSGRHLLTVVNTSSTSGYLATYCSQLRPYAMWMSARHHLILPSNHAMILSFPLYEVGSSTLKRSRRAWDGVTLLLANGTSHKLPEKWHGTIVPPAVFRESVQVHFESSNIVNFGFKVLFSFHPESETPMILPSGKFNCSVPFYASFKEHLHCNLERECENGEDEQSCPFYHPACNGTVGYGDKCYRLVAWHVPLTPTQAENICRERGGQLASIKTPGVRHAVSQLFIYGKRRFFYFVGARRNDNATLSPQYRYKWIWNDGTVAYDFNITYSKFGVMAAACALCDPFVSTECMAHSCSSITRSMVKHFLCEFDQLRPTPLSSQVIVNSFRPTASSTETFVKLISPLPPSTPVNRTRYGTKWLNNILRIHTVPASKADNENALLRTLAVCQDGHLIHDFLPCSVDSFSGGGPSVASWSTPRGGVFPKFACADRKKWIHYSMVCDFWEDCADGSDERFCVYPDTCPARTCRNSQCFEFSQRCDSVQHCVDNSDERGCAQIIPALKSTYGIPPPVVIDFDGQDEFSYRRLESTEPCPQTHFQCPGQYVYCLPVYVRCNGMYDCPGHEDEAECDSYTCPGYYRCRASSVCVHLDHLCDGVIHCPQHDDEWMCSRILPCPEGCRCQGLAFACTRPFPADAHPGLRYLDASGSGMDFHYLPNVNYIVYLDLSFSDISVLSPKHCPNLIHLDLSFNRIRVLNIDTLFSLANLRVLNLEGNPVTQLVRSQFKIRHEQLRTVNLSNSRLETFDSKYFSNFSRISAVNISFSLLHTIGTHGFNYLPNLMSLDLFRSPVKTFHSDVFRDLSLLQYIRTDNYKLCCRQTLPKYFQIDKCQAPLDEVSSCEDILRSNVYRVALWVFVALSLTGNTACLIFRLFVQRSRSKSGFNVFVTNLGVADFIMGVYLAVIGAADQVYRGNYLWHETQWKSHIACKAAGFMSLLSSEVSAFIICLITLDRFITLRFPFSTLRFVRSSARITSCIVWTLGVFLAALPLLPYTEHWMFYSQTGICIPLPVTRTDFAGLQYSFGVIVVLNFVLFLLVAVGQVSIYWSVHTNSMTGNSTGQNHDLTIARRLISVAVSDFLCWFPIGLLGIMAKRGMPISGEVNVGMAIFVLPLNSALNPFLYTFNMLMEKRRKREEAQLLEWMMSNLVPQATRLSSSSALTTSQSSALPLSRAKTMIATATSTKISSSDHLACALHFLKQNMDEQVLTYSEIISLLHATPGK